MNCNIGSLDKVIRRAMGLIIIGLGFYLKSWYGLLGLIPIVLSYLNYCPLYTPFKINTRKGGDENA